MTSEMEASELPLQSKWILYWHARENKDWSVNSYENKYQIHNVAQFWTLFNNFRTVAHDMFFLMREGHPPLWEDASNINGGGLSFRLHNKEVDNFWLVGSMLAIGETICQVPEEIIGISVSPKLRNTTIRVWYRDHNKLEEITSSLHPELLRISHDYLVRQHGTE